MIITTKLASVCRAGTWMALLALALPVYAGGGHTHGEAVHKADSHDHNKEPTNAYTNYSNTTELFVEFPPLIVNQASTLVAHFTRLDNYKPITSGILDVHLKQKGKTLARFRVKGPARKGIFLPDVTPKKAGNYQLVLALQDGELHSVHNLGTVTVFPNQNSAVVKQEQAQGGVRYLKEQQWQNPFAITRAAKKPLRPSVPGFGTVIAPADGFAIVRAASDGYYYAERFMNAGENVSQSQRLGSLIPRLGEGADIGNLLVGQEKARAQFQLAKADVQRLQGLYDQGAIPEKRLLEAQQALEVAKIELQTSQSRLAQRSGQAGDAGIALTAPIAGELVEVSVRPGSFVRAGEPLFTIADPSRRWLDIEIPEKFGQDIGSTTGAWLQHGTQTVVLDSAVGAQVVKISKQVNPRSRTVSAAIQYPAEYGPKLLGSRFAVQVYIAEPTTALAVPVSAVIDDAGRPVVYVQNGGESFARRNVRLGIHDGSWVEILQGLNPGEWVVSEGAYYVKLASTGGDAIGHGHAH